MKNREYYENIIPLIEIGLDIPKNIYQVGKNYNSIPKEITENIDKIKKDNQDWKYNFYSDDDIENYLINNTNDTIFEYYNRIEKVYGAARADFFRYILIYFEGGVYFDLKTSIRKSLNDIVGNHKFLLSTWANGWGNHPDLKDITDEGEYQQFHVCSVKGHPFLREVIISIMQNIDNYNIFKTGVGHMGVFRVTGPIAYTKAIQSIIKETDKKLYFKTTGLESSDFIYSIYENQDTDIHREKLGSTYRIEQKSIVTDTPYLIWKTYITIRNIYYKIRGIS